MRISDWSSDVCSSALSFSWLLAIALTLYMLWTVVGGHLAKDLHVRRGEGTIWQDVKDHARLRFPTGAAAARYSVLQKLAYLGVLFGLLPLMIAPGLAMEIGRASGRERVGT